MVSPARLSRLLSCLVLVFCALAAPALAHAQLLASTPPDNAVLETAPAALDLLFNEPVTPLVITLLDSAGQKTDLTAKTSAGTTLQVPLTAPLANGTHVLSWRAVSVDGHPIGGALVFSVGMPTAHSAAPQADGVTALALWATRAALFVALFIGLGGVLFRAIAPLPIALERSLAALCAAGLVLSPLSLGLHGLDALGLPLAQLGAGEAWSAALTTSYGATAIALAVAFALALGASHLPFGRPAAALGIFAAALAAFALSLSGHAGAASPQWLTRPAVFLHAAAVLFWAGALVPLAVLLARNTPAADLALARFSRLIPVPLAALLVSGATLAAVQMGPPGPSWLSPYAAILLAKLGLLAALFALALWNRVRLTRPALAGNDVSRRRLRRSILAETLLVLAVLGLVAGWRFTPPPRALAETIEVDPIFVHAMSDSVMATVTIANAPGAADLDIALTDANYDAITAQSVMVVLSSEALAIEPIRRAATPSRSGWRVDDLPIPLAGVWTLSLEIRLDRFALSKLQADFDVP